MERMGRIQKMRARALIVVLAIVLAGLIGLAIAASRYPIPDISPVKTWSAEHGAQSVLATPTPRVTSLITFTPRPTATFTPGPTATPAKVCCRIYLPVVVKKDEW